MFAILANANAGKAVPQPVSSGLIWRPKFNEGSGTNVVDYSGAGNNCTLHSGSLPTWTAQGLHFDSSQRLDMPSALFSGIQTLQLYIIHEAKSVDFQWVMGNDTSGSLNIIANAANQSNDFWPQTWDTGSKSLAFGGGYNNDITTWVLDSTADVFWAGDIKLPYYSPGNGSSGVSRTGNAFFGTSVVFAGHYFKGTFVAGLAYNRKLANAEVLKNNKYLRSIAASRGILDGVKGTKSASVTDVCYLVGDSITILFVPASITLTHFSTNAQKLQYDFIGSTAQQWAATQIPWLSSQYAPGATRNYLHFWIGTNDIAAGRTATQTATDIKTSATAWKARGFTVLVGTMMSRSGFDAGKNALNALLRSDPSLGVSTYGCTLVDYAADVNLGADGAFSNATYFQGDGIHPTTFALTNDIYPILQTAVNGLG